MGYNFFEDYKPVNVYRNNVKLAGWTATEKSGESVSYTDTYNDKFDSLVADGAEPQIADNVIKEANNNALAISNATEVKQTVNLPTLRAIGTVKDRCDILTGVKTHKVSEWITIPQPTSYFQCLSSLDGFKRLNISALWDYYYGQVTPLIAYKYNGTQLMVRSTSSYSDSIQGSTVDSGTRISVSNTDSGWSDALTPTNAEVKAYFLGWQMCHSDGASPYYKSEVPYTPATWAEWTVNNGATKAATGIELTPYEQSVVGAWINTTIKNNTKYGIIFNIVSNTLNGFMSVGSGSRAISFGTMSAGITGMQKLIATSVAAISNNSFIMYINSASVTSGIVNFKDVRIFELPTGSQIEADFTNLTADQLAIKYPFYGLNPKNWKHITDGTGLTATLPTATYAGYTPYRLLYQLATPTDEQLTGETVPTYPWHTDITQTGDIKTTITANAKVMD